VDDDPQSRFRSHKNYIEAFTWIGGMDWRTSAEDALASIAAQAETITLDSKPMSMDLAQVEKSLRNGWSTEILLGMPRQWASDEDEFMRLSNSWGVVQTYYVGYHLTQALNVAKGMPRPNNHPTTQQQFATHWTGRVLNLPPWSFGLAAAGWMNLPTGVVIDETIHPWRACNTDTAWSLAAKAIRTTRDEAVKRAEKKKRDRLQSDARKAWLSDEGNRTAGGRRPRRQPAAFARPRLNAAQRIACDGNVRTFTVLDYLYRLRVAANYDDAAVFHSGPENEAESFWLQTRLSFLAAGLALTSEVRIRELVGPARFHRWADGFIATNIGSGFDLGIKARRHLL
jgi:hypothetical protein